MQKFEDYLEEMYELYLKSELITSKEIVKRLGVSRSSVSQMLRKLKKENYIDFKPYGNITLLEKGIKIGKKISETHEVLELLFEKLRIDKTTALNDIHGLEHFLSEGTLERIKKLNKHLDKFPLNDDTN